MADVVAPAQGTAQYVQTTLQTAHDSDGAVDNFLAAIWNRSDIDTMAYTVVGVFPTSSSGSYSSLGSITASQPGTPFPAGGLYIYLLTPQDVRNFRIQAVAGGTVTFTGVAYR